MFLRPTFWFEILSELRLEEDVANTQGAPAADHGDFVPLPHSLLNVRDEELLFLPTFSHHTLKKWSLKASHHPSFFATQAWFIMMREEDENEDQPKQNVTSPFVWSARRVRLAVRTSLSSSVASRRDLFEDDENDSSSQFDENSNIDQAMLGLYRLPNESSQVVFPDRRFSSSFVKAYSARRTNSVYDIRSLLNQSSSYIPQDDWDPLLDGGFRDVAEEQRTQELSQALWHYESSGDWKIALSKENETMLDHDDESGDASGEGEDRQNDEDDFGDFQSADGAPATNGEGKQTKEEALVETPASSQDTEVEGGSLESSNTFTTINTASLVKRVDDLLSESTSMEDHPLATSLSSDYPTPLLLAQSKDILRRDGTVTRHEETLVFVNEGSDSEASPSTGRRASLSYATPARQVSKEFSASHKVSLELPVSDLTSIEGRWIRRRQLEAQGGLAEEWKPEEQNLDEVLASLPEPYQISLDKIDEENGETNAHTVRILNSVPWGCVQLDETGVVSSEQDMSVWDEFFASQLSQLDSSLESVHRIMAASVRPHLLEDANKMVHSCEQNLRLAMMYWDRSSEALNAAIAAGPDGKFTGKGILGNAHLLKWWQQREEFAKLDSLLGRLESVIAQESEIVHRIDTFDAKHSRAQDEYAAVVSLGNHLREALDGELSSLVCLEELRHNRLTSILEERFWNRLKYLAQQGVVQQCRSRNESLSEYQSLMKAALGLFEASRANLLLASSSSSSHDPDSGFDVLTGWSRNMSETIMYELERCLAVALLEPVDSIDSEFVKDLKILELEMAKGWGDSPKLRTLTHNLVTIRFDFEATLCYFPKVVLRLCECLVDVLKAHLMFHRYHAEFEAVDGQSTDADMMISVAEGLGKSARSLWEKCESILIHIMEEYRHFSSRRNLRPVDGSGLDFSSWEKELQGLHTVYCVLCSFFNLKNAFFESCHSNDNNLDSEQPSVLEAFSGIVSDHLRIVHAEAMTTLGRMLARETWHLVSFQSPEDSEKKMDRSTPTPLSAEVLTKSVSSTVRRHKGLTADFAPTHEAADPSPDFSTGSIPFLRPRPTGLSLSWVETTDEEQRLRGVYNIIDSAVRTPGDDPLRLATQSIAGGLVEWVSRLMLVALKVPLVTESVCCCIENLFDLYFTTVFRLCAGSRRNERILFGEGTSGSSSDLSPIPLAAARTRASSPTTLLRGLGNERRLSGKPPTAPLKASTAISPTLDVEICSPMLADSTEIEKVRQFIDRAQQELHGSVNLNRVDSWIGNPNVDDDPEEYACAVAKSIERREAAAWSCLVAAGLAGVILSVMERNILVGVGRGGSGLKRFMDYIHDMESAIVPLSRKCSEVSCARGLAPFVFVKEIVLVGGEWEESKLHEHPNDYVDSLCERVSLIWGFVAASGKLPQHLVSKVWARLQTIAYLTLLEGFSRVMYCSTEGRALMALDLASLSSNLRSDSVCERLEYFDLPLSPPSVCPKYGMQYVDLYIKVFYYPQDDILSWISDNCQHYRFHHMVSLLCSAGFRGRGNPPQEILERVKHMYSTKQVDE